MATEEVARRTACELSRTFRTTKVFRVYRTLSGDHWVGMDEKPRRQVDGIRIKHIANYRNGEEVQA